MAGPDLAFLESLNALLPYVLTIVVAIVMGVVFVWYTKKYTPEIARTFIKAYHNRALPVFLQDEMGNVALYICDKKFPEGVVHVKDKGWYLLPTPPSPSEPKEAVEEEKRGPGRPAKVTSETYKSAEEFAKLSEEAKQAYAAAYGVLVQTPILRGFGKQVFFGSTVASALSNLTAIAHADLLNVRKLSPAMYQKTQLDALATGSRIEGMKMAGKETTKLLMYAIIAAVPIAVTAIAAWLLTQHPEIVLMGLI